MRKCEHFSDLHLHKGGDSLEQILEAAKKSGKKVVSVVDKESIDHIRQLEECCKKYDLVYVRGVEVNARYENKVYHFLVYNFRRQDMLKRLLKKEVKAKRERALKVAKKLEKMGWVINWKILLEKPDYLLGRKMIVNNIFSNPANEDRLLREGIFTRDDFYCAYLNFGQPAYFARKVLSVSFLIKTAHKAGGVVVWAHPVRTICEHFKKIRLNGEFMSVFTALKNAGIDGVEVYYPGVTEEQISFLCHLCRKYNLFITAGSDSREKKLIKIPKLVDGCLPDDIRYQSSLYRGVS